MWKIPYFVKNTDIKEKKKEEERNFYSVWIWKSRVFVCFSHFSIFNYNKSFWMVSSSVEQLLCQDSGTMWVLVSLRSAFFEIKKCYQGKFGKMGDQNANFEEEMRNRQQEMVNGGCSSNEAKKAFQKQRSKWVRAIFTNFFMLKKSLLAVYDEQTSIVISTAHSFFGVSSTLLFLMCTAAQQPVELVELRARENNLSRTVGSVHSGCKWGFVSCHYPLPMFKWFHWFFSTSYSHISS